MVVNESCSFSNQGNSFQRQIHNFITNKTKQLFLSSNIEEEFKETLPEKTVSYSYKGKI